MSEQALKPAMASYVIAFTGVFLFSLKPIFIKIAYRYGVDTTTLMTLRMSFSLPIYLVVGLYLFVKNTGESHSTLKLAPKIMLVGLLGYYGASFFDLKALQLISAQFERLVLYAYPTIVVILGFIFFNNPIYKGTIPALLATYTGICVLFVHELDTFGPESIRGGGLVVISAFLFALYILFSKKLMTKVGSLVFTTISMCSASIAILLHFLATNELRDLIQPSEVYIIALVIAVVSTVIPSFLINEAINRLGANTTSIVGTSGTVFTAMLAILVLDEPFTIYHVVALVLVVSGMIWIGKKSVT